MELSVICNYHFAFMYCFLVCFSLPFTDFCFVLYISKPIHTLVCGGQGTDFLYILLVTSMAEIENWLLPKASGLPTLRKF